MGVQEGGVEGGEVRMDGVQWQESEEKPQRNKRPSGLIRRQIGCRAQRGGGGGAYRCGEGERV